MNDCNKYRILEVIVRYSTPTSLTQLQSPLGFSHSQQNLRKTLFPLNEQANTEGGGVQNMVTQT